MTNRLYIPGTRNRTLVMLLAGFLTALAAADTDRRDRVTKEDLVKLYDLSNPQIDLDEMLAPGVPKDGIHFLTNPKRIKARAASYPQPGERVAVVDFDGEAVAYPLGILNFHEVANDTVGGVAVAVTYCPLCDSVAVMDRRLKIGSESGPGEEIVLEFGISGFLYNSNMVLYDQTSMGLWSQVYLKAFTGKFAGESLNYLPVRIMKFGAFREKYPEGEVLSTDTGFDEPYERNPYADYLTSERVFRGHDFGFKKDLPPKTLGLGLKVGSFAAFVTAELARKGPVKIETPEGLAIVTADEAGVMLQSAPAGTRALQTFYHSWSAFHPQTKVFEVEK